MRGQIIATDHFILTRFILHELSSSESEAPLSALIQSPEFWDKSSAWICQTLRLGSRRRHEAPPVMVPFRRSPARPFPVLPHHRLGVLPLGSLSLNTAQSPAA